jgi:hypothetical protein
MRRCYDDGGVGWDISVLVIRRLYKMWARAALTLASTLASKSSSVSALRALVGSLCCGGRRDRLNIAARFLRWSRPMISIVSGFRSHRAHSWCDDGYFDLGCRWQTWASYSLTLVRYLGFDVVVARRAVLCGTVFLSAVWRRKMSFSVVSLSGLYLSSSQAALSSSRAPCRSHFWYSSYNENMFSGSSSLICWAALACLVMYWSISCTSR